MSTYQEAIDYPAGEWFTVADLTGGKADYACWDRLCTAAMAHYARHGDFARLTMNEARSRFYWQPRVHRGEIALSAQQRPRRRQL